MTELLPISHFEALTPVLIQLLQDLVEQESPTTSKHAVDILGEKVSGEMKDLGAIVERFPQSEVGDHWLGSWGEGDDGILLMFHLDTVYPRGTLQTMPWRESEDFIMGPGVLDMKASIAMALIAIRASRDAGLLPAIKLSMLCTSDEETGSQTSCELIEALARRHRVVFCMEPALRDGSLKTWRKGISNFIIETNGVSAHAGASITDGVNAIVEMGLQIPRILELQDNEGETTINIGVIEGGTRSNVVPQKCRSRVDVRTKTFTEGERVAKALQRLEPQLQGAGISVTGGWNRPPMERSPLIRETFEKARSIADKIGLSLTEGGTGGGSDANFVAPLGIPILDGLGAIGKGAHSSDERVEKGTLPARTALISALITDWWGTP